MASITITVTGIPAAANLGLTKAADCPRDALRNLRNLFHALALSGYPGTAVLTASANNAVRSSGTLTISSGSGTVGGVVNGTTVTVTWATSDTNTAGLLAAAINANTTVNKLVSATSAAGVVTLTANVSGIQGNAISLTATGTGVSANGAGKLGGTTAGAGSDAAPTTYNLS